MCVQPETKLAGVESTTNQTLIDAFLYHSSSDHHGLVAERSLYKDPVQLARLGFPLVNFTQRHQLSQFIFATAADHQYIYASIDAIARIQAFFPNHSIYFYDLSDGVLDGHVDKVSYTTTNNNLPLVYIAPVCTRLAFSHVNLALRQSV